MSERKGKEMGEYLILDDLVDGLNRHDLSKYLVPPEAKYARFSCKMNRKMDGTQYNGQATAQFDDKTGKSWICCPWCGKKAFPVCNGTVIRNMKWKCKSSSCKKEFFINVE